MDAHIKPLRGKHYGTEINTPYGVIVVWLIGTYPEAREPSWREQVSWGPSEWSDEELKHEMMASGHYETQLSYDVAEVIVDALRTKLPQYP